MSREQRAQLPIGLLKKMKDKAIPLDVGLNVPALSNSLSRLLILLIKASNWEVVDMLIYILNKNFFCRFFLWFDYRKQKFRLYTSYPITDNKMTDSFEGATRSSTVRSRSGNSKTKQITKETISVDKYVRFLIIQPLVQ